MRIDEGGARVRVVLCDPKLPPALGRASTDRSAAETAARVRAAGVDAMGVSGSAGIAGLCQGLCRAGGPAGSSTAGCERTEARVDVHRFEAPTTTRYFIYLKNNYL